MVALTIYEASLCDGCGHPKQDVYTDRGDYVPSTVTCLACAAIGKYERDENPGPGVKVYAVDDSAEDD